MNKGSSHHPQPSWLLGTYLQPGAQTLLPASSHSDAPLSRSPSGDPKKQGGGSRASPGVRWGGRMSSRGCSTAGDQLDPSSPLGSRKIAVSFLLPKTTQQQERSCLRTRQGPSVLQTEEPAAGKPHTRQAAEGWTPRQEGSASGYPPWSGPLAPQQPHAQIQHQPSPHFGRAACAGHHGSRLDLSIHPSIRL